MGGVNGDVAWLIESSRNGKKWRTMGRAWTHPHELLLVHGASTYLRYRDADGEPGEDGEHEWTGPLERTDDACMALLDLEAGTRVDIWPTDDHLGLPVFLPGGEAGRLLSFDCDPSKTSWTYRLEFSGVREPAS